MTDNFIPVERGRRCIVCGEPVDQVEVNFEAPLHPGACERQLWAEYIQALKYRSRPVNDPARNWQDKKLR